MNLTIQHDKNSNQFSVIVDGQLSRLDYYISADGKTLDYHSTFVPSALRGRHIGEYLVKYALDYAKQNNLKIIPSCPFVQRIIERHPEYKALIR